MINLYQLVLLIVFYNSNLILANKRAIIFVLSLIIKKTNYIKKLVLLV